MGGGRRTFIPKTEVDHETNETSDKGRLDGRNLINVISYTITYKTH